MQPVTVALSPTGIEYLIRTLIGDQIAKALETNLTAPNYSFTIPDFNYLPGGSAVENDYSNITISLSSGAFKSFTPVFQSFSQNPSAPNQFTITMVAANIELDYNWNETYNLQQYTWNRGGMKVRWGQPSTPNNNFGYSIRIPTLTIQAIFGLSVAGGAYVLTYVSSSADPGNPQPNIPGDSILNQQNSYDCGYASKISDATVQQLDNINYGSCVAAALNPIFASISQSGQLGPVTFDFLAPGDSGLAFPAGGGVQIGAKGGVSVNGVPFAASAPADLTLPPIPAGNPAPHATYFVQDYELDALCWGFFKAGLLQTTLTDREVGDSQALQTDTYAGGSLNALPTAYPDDLMTAGLTALAAPTVQFTNLYQITAASLAKVQAALGPTVWGQYGIQFAALPPCFASQERFEHFLGNQIPALMTYAATIEQCILAPGVLVTHTVRCVLNVLVSGNPVPVITFDVAQSFAMQSLALGLSSTGNAQSVIFIFIEPFGLYPVATFVSSTLQGVDGGDFIDIWSALRPNWADVFAEIGKAGMPLPRIPGFEFVFDQSTVTVNAATGTADGYIAITTNVSYVPEALAPSVQQAISGRRAARAA